MFFSRFPKTICIIKYCIYIQLSASLTDIDAESFGGWMAKITLRQQEILEFIQNSIEVLGAPPTRAEIANAFGFSSNNAAEEHLKALAKRG